MIISSIEITNIRSYSYEKINFNSGITFLSGDIGSGKSSILQAMEFALFGFKRGDLEGFHLLRKGETKGSVSLSLKNKNEILSITRNLKKTKSGIVQENGILKSNLVEEELAPMELTAKLFELLNYPKEFLTKDRNLLYRFSTYTPQEQLKEILYSEHEKRLEVIRKLFRVDKYKLLQNVSDLYLKDLRDRKIVLSTKLEGTEDIENKTKDIESKIKTLKGNNNKLTMQLKPYLEKIQEIKAKENLVKMKSDDLRKKELQLEKNISTLEELKKQKIQLLHEVNELKKKDSKKELKDIDLKKEKIDLEIKKLDDLILTQNTLKESIEKKLLEFKDKELEKEKLQLQLSSLKKEFDNTKKLLKENKPLLLKCQIKDLQVISQKKESKLKKVHKKEKELTELKEKKDELKITLLSTTKEIEHKKSHLNNIYGLSTCTLCKQDISIAQRESVKSELNSEIENLEKENQSCESTIKSLASKIEVVELELQDLEHIKLEVLELEHKINQLKEDFKKELSQQNSLKDLLKNKEKEILEIKDKLSKINLDLKKEFEHKSKAIINDIENSQKKIQELKLDKEKYIHQKLLLLESIDREEKHVMKLEKIEKNLSKESQLKDTLEKVKINLKKLEENELKIKQSLDSLKNKEQELNVKLSEVTTELRIQNDLLDEIKEKALKLEKIKKEFLSLQEKYTFLEDKIIPSTTQIEKSLFTKFWVEFNEHFIAIFKELIEDQEFDVYLRDDFSIVVEQNGYEIDISNLSGGEKSSLAVAYRLALKTIIESNLGNLNKLQLLILDEPTDGFSEQQVSRLGYLLKESNLDQIILVSHDEKIETIADNILHVEKRNHESKIL